VLRDLVGVDDAVALAGELPDTRLSLAVDRALRDR
jgi:hypothetical protein